MKRLRDGHVRLYTKDGNAYYLDPGEFDRVRAEWMAGKAFVDTVGFYGEPFTVKLASVEGIGLLHRESWEAADLDTRETEKEDKARKLLDGDS